MKKEFAIDFCFQCNTLYFNLSGNVTPINEKGVLYNFSILRIKLEMVTNKMRNDIQMIFM